MKKIISALFLSLAIFMLSSCDNSGKNSNKTIEKAINEIDIPEYVYSDLDFLDEVTVDGKTVKLTYDVSSDLISNKGKVSSVTGDVNVTIKVKGTLDDKTLTKEFKVIVTGEKSYFERFEKGKSEKKIEEVNNFIENINKKINKSNYVTNNIGLVLSVNGFSTTTSALTKMIRSPFSLDVTSDYTGSRGDLHVLYEEESSRIVKYQRDDRSPLYVKREVVDISKDDLSKNIMTFDKLNFNDEKIGISFKDNTYKVRIEFLDFLESVSVEELNESFSDLINQFKKMGNNDIIVEFEIEDLGASSFFKVKLNTSFEEGGEQQKVKLLLNTEYLLDEFTKYEFPEECKIESPTCIDDVTKLSVLDEKIGAAGEKNFAMFNLKKGYYAIDIKDIVSQDFEYEVLDKDGNKVNTFLGIHSQYYSLMNLTFSIETDGLYYINVYKNERKSSYYLRRFDYNTVMDPNNPINIKNGSNVTGINEGKYDFDYFEYTGSKGSILRITNNLNSSVNIVFSTHGDDTNFYNVNLGAYKYQYVELKKGSIKIFVAPEYQGNTYKFDVSFTEEVPTKYPSKERAKTLFVDKEYSEYVYIGLDLDINYFKFDIENPGTYTILAVDENGNETHIQTTLSYFDDVERTIPNQLNKYSTYVISKGTYLIHLHDNGGDIHKVKIKIIFEK